MAIGSNLIKLDSKMFAKCKVVALIFCISCSKVKTDSALPVVPLVNAPGSSIRLFNFYGTGLDISINNVRLTNFDSTGVNTLPTPLGQPYFPNGVWTDAGANGGSFTLPTNFVDRRGLAHLYIKDRMPLGRKSVRLAKPIDTFLTSDPLNPKDYYILYTGEFKVVPRNISVPSNPTNIKIRLINFSSGPDDQQLYGPVTLTYADGRPVDANRLTNIPQNGISSYVEIPYGVYEFGVRVDNDPLRKLTQFYLAGSSNVAKPYGVPNVNWCNTALLQPQDSIFNPLLTYKPGGTYTIVINKSLFSRDCRDAPNFAEINSFRVIQENTPPVNYTFAQVQPINLIPGKSVKFWVDGSLLTPLLPYGNQLVYGSPRPYAAKDYPLVVGPHLIEALDSNGVRLASNNFTFSAYDYITVWVYASNGTPQIAFSNTDMTFSQYYFTNAYSNLLDDGTDGSLRRITPPSKIAWQTRFLNLSDLPFATFTSDGSLFASISPGAVYTLLTSTINLYPGYVPIDNPFVISYTTGSGNETGTNGIGRLPSSIRVYESDPGPPAVIPGTLRYDLGSLSPANYIVDLSSYPRNTVVTEPGFYTTVLAGNTTARDTGQQHLFIFKHNN